MFNMQLQCNRSRNFIHVVKENIRKMNNNLINIASQSSDT